MRTKVNLSRYNREHKNVYSFDSGDNNPSVVSLAVALAYFYFYFYFCHEVGLAY